MKDDDGGGKRGGLIEWMGWDEVRLLLLLLGSEIASDSATKSVFAKAASG
jgi:hypothetical protein